MIILMSLFLTFNPSACLLFQSLSYGFMFAVNIVPGHLYYGFKALGRI